MDYLIKPEKKDSEWCSEDEVSIDSPAAWLFSLRGF